MARLDSAEEQRPSPFRLRDVLIYGGLSYLVTEAAWYVQTHDYEGPSGARALMWVVAGAFWLIAILIVRARYLYIKKYDLVLSDGTMVHTGGYRITRSLVEDEIARVVKLYEPYYLDPGRVLRRKRIWIEFSAGPITLDGFHNKDAKTFAGLVNMGGTHIRLTYFNDYNYPIERTALAHELGHVIIGRATEKWDNEYHHQLMKGRSLP